MDFLKPHACFFFSHVGTGLPRLNQYLQGHTYVHTKTQVRTTDLQEHTYEHAKTIVRTTGRCKYSILSYLL